MVCMVEVESSGGTVWIASQLLTILSSVNSPAVMLMLYNVSFEFALNELNYDSLTLKVY